MKDITSALNSTVSISLFNKGLAGQIFDEVRTDGPKVVIKNNSPECVLISPSDYVEMMNAIPKED